MSDLCDEIRDCRDWVQQRLEALDKIEGKLLKMRELATYASTQNLSEHESAQVQEWLNILQAEVNAIEEETAWGEKDFGLSNT